MPNLRTFFVVSSFLGATGCSLIVAPDAGLLGDGGDNQGGAGGQGGAQGGTGGEGGEGGAMCEPASCPGVDTDCRTRSCEDNACGFADARAGTSCADDDGGNVCDGNGECIGCIEPADCSDPLEPLCVEGECVPLHCDNRMFDPNESESDVDCGGDCADCANGLSCNTFEDCESAFCEGDPGVCSACDADDDCQDGDYCDASDSCVAKRPDGNPCEADNECLNDACADDFCCDDACDSSCEACDVAGVEGVCTLHAIDTDPDDECGTDVCDGDNSCKCANLAMDGNESDIDCGGGVCGPCAIGDSCVLGTDCATGTCVGQVCVDPTCGDGFVTGNDQCDGNGTGTPGQTPTCDDDCTFVSCDDGNVNGAAGETCDDSDATGGDGCSALCTTEAGFNCGGEPSVCTTTCGDGIVAGAEGCDDATVGNNDDCPNGAAGTCQPASCTDGFRHNLGTGTESDVDCGGACPDCPNGDTCNAPSDCVSGVCTGGVCVAAVCGNGAQEPGEVCDDGFVTACGACNATCTAAGTGSTCGDGTVCPDTEFCDDDSTTACGPCNATCTAAGTGSVCGDGTVCPDTEFCDDDSNTACGPCNATCTAAGTGSVCGDGTVCPDTEFCDDDSTTACGPCNATCTAAGTGSVCGDGTVCPDTEFCDDDNTTACGPCNATCTAAGTGSVCGDGTVCPDTEFCDDDSNTACGPCNATCTAAGTGSTCGDGTVCPDTEFCDDDNTTACGPCNATCTAAGTASTCGDGILCPDTEFCDDDNNTACGPCNATCTAAGTGSTCGDGVICSDTEACDDSNSDACGPCNATCNGAGVGTCANGIGCAADGQCTSGFCNPTTDVCTAPACPDGFENGDETDLDCGGSCATNCADGDNCNTGDDCVSGLCAGSVCTAPMVIMTSPADGSTGVLETLGGIDIVFNTAMNPSTLSVQTVLSSTGCTGSIQVSTDNFVSCIPFTGVVMSVADTVATIDPAPGLSFGSTYDVRVTTAAQAASGAPLGSQFDTGAGIGTRVSPALPGVVISQIYGSGGNAGASYTHDFIELHNRSAAPVNITGWSVQYASAAGTTWQVTPLSATSIPAGGYFLVQEGGGATGAALPPADATGTIMMAATNGKVALVSSSTALNGTCPTANVVDFVGFGTANCFEGAAAAESPADPSQSMTRPGAGCIDGNDNALDFEPATVLAPGNPGNSMSPTYVCRTLDVRNETGDEQEIDFCNVQFPTSVSTTSGSPVDVFARVFETGVTPGAGQGAGISAELGYGPRNTNPQHEDAGWIFSAASYNSGFVDPSDDEYEGTFTAPAPGSYSYVYRMSQDGGDTWTYCDLNGAGSNTGLVYETPHLPLMTVTP